MPKFTKLEVTGVVVKAEATLTPAEARRLDLLPAVDPQPGLAAEEVDRLINFTDYSEEPNIEQIDRQLDELKHSH